MPHVDENLIDGLSVSRSADGYKLTRVFHCKDLTGTTPTDVIVQALSLTSTGTSHTGANIPEQWEAFTFGGRSFWCKDADAVPWSTNDAIVTCTYDTISPPVAGFGPLQIEVGASLEQSETDFDFENLQLPFASRSPITVFAPLDIAEEEQSVRVPIYVPKACLIITRQESSSPEPRSDGWVGWTNSDTFRGYAANTVLMLDIRGRNGGDGIWNTTYWMARDPLGKWKQIARWRNTDGTFPKLTPADLAGGGDIGIGYGIREVIVQGSKAFGPLGLG